MVTYWDIRRMLTWLFKLLARVEVEGVERIPQTDGFLLVTNHTSRLDTPLLSVVSPRRIYPLTADKYRTFPVFNWILNVGEAIWINRSEFDREALVKSIDVLRRGDVLGIAPEGSRSPDGVLQRAKPGVAFLAARTGVSVVPVAITGTRSMAQDFRRLRRMRIRVVFGEPFRLPKYGKLSTDELAVATDLIMGRIAALLPPAYRGVYASSITESQMSI